MLEIKTVEKPDERRDFPRGHLEAVHLTGLDFAVGVFEPGWRWSESVRTDRGHGQLRGPPQRLHRAGAHAHPHGRRW